jgi:hypothetical protein
MFAQRFREALIVAGYANSVTTAVGRVSAEIDPLYLPRLPVNSTDDLPFLAAKISGAYDWFATPQHIRKQIVHRLYPSSPSKQRHIHLGTTLPPSQ